jgi:hypothetical protein
MKRRVQIPSLIWMTVTVDTESDDESEIIEEAMEFANLTEYGGNGGSHGKLVGTDEENVIIEVSNNEPFECEGISITVLEERER